MCKNQVDTPPLPGAIQDGAKCFSPTLSHTLTVVLGLKFVCFVTLVIQGGAMAKIWP